jgi:hypothetical protein
MNRAPISAARFFFATRQYLIIFVGNHFSFLSESII